MSAVVLIVGSASPQQFATVFRRANVWRVSFVRWCVGAACDRGVAPLAIVRSNSDDECGVIDHLDGRRRGAFANSTGVRENDELSHLT